MYQSIKEVKNRVADVIDGATGKVIGTVGATGLAVASNSAFAVGPDFTTLTSGVDFSTVGPALLSIAVLISGVYVIWKGAKLILGAVKSA